MTEPFADAARFRASIANYEYVGGPRSAPEPPLLREVNPTPALILYGPEDHVIPREFPQRMEAAFPDRAGPFVVPGAGHFLQWERADVLNGALRWLCLPS
jgi:pimeloyl-ACP methyl ester carboxylesterase